MDKRPMKTVGESRTEQVQIVLPGHSNGDGRLFGGRLLEWRPPWSPAGTAA